MPTTLPWRGDAPGATRPADLEPLPPARMTVLRGGRPLKRWRYVGVYGPELMLCAGAVRIGGIPQAFWAVWDRGKWQLRERTAFGRGGVALPEGAARVRARGAEILLVLEPTGDPVEVVSRHGAQHIWTRKLPVHAHGSVTLDDRTLRVDAAGLVDDSAGYHARETAWDWSAGVGTSTAGEPVAWNLVTGVHDAPRGSERTVWVSGTASEPPPVAFAPDLDAVGDLRFTAEAERARHDNVVVFASDYRQPFGTFRGTLPGGVELAEGFGVMERHAVRW